MALGPMEERQVCPNLPLNAAYVGLEDLDVALIESWSYSMLVSHIRQGREHVRLISFSSLSSAFFWSTEP